MGFAFGWCMHAGDDLFRKHFQRPPGAQGEHLGAAGFGMVFTALGAYEIRAIAFKQAPTPQQKALLGLPQ